MCILIVNQIATPQILHLALISSQAVFSNDQKVKTKI